MIRTWLKQVKASDRSVNIAPQTSFSSCANSIFFYHGKKCIVGIFILTISVLISRKCIFKKIIDLIIQTPLVNFWIIWKNTDRTVVTFFFSTIFFIQGRTSAFWKFLMCSPSLTIIFVILSFERCWKEKEESEFSVKFFIGIMLICFLYS